MRRRLDDAVELPEDADWAQLSRAERKVARALWITEGAGPYAAVDAFARTYPDLAAAIDYAVMPAWKVSPHQLQWINGESTTCRDDEGTADDDS